MPKNQLDSSVIINPNMLQKISHLKKQPVLINIFSLAQQYRRIRDIINASPLTDMKTFKCLLYLEKLHYLSLTLKTRIDVQIVTDSTVDLPLDIIRNNNIIVAPLKVSIDQEIYKDGIDITPELFYEYIEVADSHPFTSPVSVEEFQKLFLKIIQEKDILGIFISRRMSLTYENALSAKANNYDNYLSKRRLKHSNNSKFQLDILNSENASLAMGLLVLEAVDKTNEGWPIERIRSHLESLIPLGRTFIMVDTLKYLERGGKVGKAKALLGTLLKVKPILTIKDGELAPAEQAMGSGKGLKRIKTLIRRELEMYPKRPPILAGVMHAKVPDKAIELREFLEQEFECKQIVTSQIGSATGTHLGPGAIGVSILPLLDS